VAQVLLSIRRFPGRISKRLGRINPGEDRAEEDVDLLKEVELDNKILEKKQEKDKIVKLDKLYLAGYHARGSRRRFLICKFIVTLGLIVASFWLREIKQLSMFHGLMLGFSSFVLGWIIVPNLWLSSRIKTRQDEIVSHLADTMDLLVICLEAGLGFDAALLKVATEQRRTSRILSDELFYTNREILAGKPRSDAFHSLSLRCGNQPDVRSLVAVIIQSERFGSSMGQTLRVHSESLRFKRSQRIREAVTKIPVKLLFPLVFCILPALFVILIGPAALSLMANLARIAK